MTSPEFLHKVLKFSRVLLETFPRDSTAMNVMRIRWFPSTPFRILFTLRILGPFLPLMASEPGASCITDDQPAGHWEKDAYPLGNGSLGCMMFGGVDHEEIFFNHDTLWVGSERNTGAYQPFGTLGLTLESHPGPVTDYRRQLDLASAVFQQRHTTGGITFTREAFASHPAGVLVFHLTADQPGALSGTLSLQGAHGAETRAGPRHLRFSGTLDPSHHQYRGETWENPICLRYAAELRVLHRGGSVESEGALLRFRDCDKLTVLLAADTDFVRDRSQGWKGSPPLPRVIATLDATVARPYDELRQEHVKDYRSLFTRCTLQLDSPEPAPAFPTTRAQLQAVQAGQTDPAFATRMFQMARYLMISSSRPGSQPANLQGLWNPSKDPPWRSDYHSNVNLQMNYWFVDPGNLAECFSPLADWFFSIREVRREETREHFGKRGFAMHTENGLFGGSTWEWSVGDASWLANSLYDHYRFSRDKAFLQDRIFPILQDLTDFWEDHLVSRPNPDGEGTVWVAPQGFSPEHGPREDGVSFDQQWAWDLLNNTAEAAAEFDPDLQQRVIRFRDQLLGPRIGDWGQLREWMVHPDDPASRHRHVSHLVGLHPGRQISPLTTPALAEAARVSLNARGDGGTGWSKAWKISFWARLHDGDRAHRLLQELLKQNVTPNLFAHHPPFQIDANFGLAAGMHEMLLQSHLDTVHLLPALPSAWPTGTLTGTRARNGFEVDLSWQDGELTQARIHSLLGHPLYVRYRNQTLTLHPKKGTTLHLTPADFGSP
jgi:alpha-L-fucosidase 2